MITIRIDSIRQAVSIERGEQQRIYCPSAASLRRILRLPSQLHWICRPTFYLGIHCWELARMTPQGVQL